MKELLGFVDTYNEETGMYRDPEAGVLFQIRPQGCEVNLGIPGQPDRQAGEDCPNVFCERREGMWVLIIAADAGGDHELIVRIKDDETVSVQPCHDGVEIVTP